MSFVDFIDRDKKRKRKGSVGSEADRGGSLPRGLVVRLHKVVDIVHLHVFIILIYSC